MFAPSFTKPCVIKLMSVTALGDWRTHGDRQYIWLLAHFFSREFASSSNFLPNVQTNRVSLASPCFHRVRDRFETNPIARGHSRLPQTTINCGLTCEARNEGLK
jgi:hypothetical protein